MKLPDLRPLVVVVILLGLLDAVVGELLRSTVVVGVGIAVELAAIAFVLLTLPTPEVHVHIAVAPGIAVRSDPDSTVVRL